MVVRFYNFSKRTKETIQPINLPYHEVNCHLKEGTTVLDPILLLQTFDANKYNYVFIPDFKRFYFIANAKYIEGMYEVILTEDLLGSYKSEIGSTVCNILYASGSTKNIVDSRIPVTASVLRGHNYNAVSGMTITEGSGAIILSITGVGSFGNFLMKDSTQVRELLDGMDMYVSSLSDLWDLQLQMFYGGSAANNLKAAIAIPLVIGGSDVSGLGEKDLRLGAYPCKDNNGNNIKGYPINKPILKYNGSIDIPWQSSDWKRVAGYTEISLYLPFIGIISIPATEAMNDSSLTAAYAINVTSGDISVEVRGSSTGRKFAVANGNCAMNTPYGASNIDTGRLTSAVVTGIGAAAAAAGAIVTGGASIPATAAIGAGFASAASQAIQAMGGTGIGSGGLGGGSTQGLDKVMHCWVTQKILTDTQSNLDPIIGKPYMAVGTPNRFLGYVQTDGFMFRNANAYSVEIDKINQLMDSGIYFT